MMSGSKNARKMPKVENHARMGDMPIANEQKPQLISGEPYKSTYILPEEVTENTTIEDVACSIANNPNLWGAYSIADAFNGLVEWEVKKRLNSVNQVS